MDGKIMRFKQFEQYGTLVTHLDLADCLVSEGEKKANAATVANDIFWQIRSKLRSTSLLVCIECAKQAGICRCKEQFKSAKWVMPVKELLTVGTKVATKLSPRSKAGLLAYIEYWQHNS